MSMTADELVPILAAHALWVRGEPGGVRADLTNVDMSGVNMSGAFLRKALLRGANMSDVNMSWADLTNVDMSGVNMSGANMSGAVLRDAIIEAANMTGVDLTMADMAGVKMFGAVLHGAGMRGAKGIISLGPIGSEGWIIYAVRHPETVMVQVGCWWGTVDDLEARVTRVHGSTDRGRAYMGAIRFIRSYADSYWRLMDERGSPRSIQHPPYDHPGDMA